MFTVEIRINGTLIAHVYGRNVGSGSKQGLTHYYYELYRTGNRNLITGDVEHKRDNGIEALIVKVLADAMVKDDHG